MSSNNTDKDENENSNDESSGFVIAGIAGAVGVAIGAGLAYFLGGSNESPQCSAANGPSGDGRNTTSSTFRNRNITCESCAVCLDSISSITVLPCTHRFHTSCIKPWLDKQRTCPTCRKSVPRGSERQY